LITHKRQNEFVFQIVRRAWPDGRSLTRSF
jgi:hypothetical protein